MQNIISYTPRAFVGKKAPEFTGTLVQDDKFTEAKLSDYKGKWVVLFFYPMDFTFVCPTEICNFSDSKALFNQISI